MPSPFIRSHKGFFLSALTIVFVVAVWYIVTTSGAIRAIFLPSPGDTLVAMWELVIDGRFVEALAISFSRIAAATVLAVVFGSIIGIAMGASKTFDALASPITQPLRYLPITAIIPLLVLWFGIGEAMKIIFLFVGIAFYFIPLVANAIRTVPTEYVQVAKTFGAKKWTIVKRVYAMHALPQIFDGFIVINGIGWTYVILAEIVNAQDGLGYLINIAGRLQRSDEVFAGLILIALVAIGSDRILRRIKERRFFW